MKDSDNPSRVTEMLGRVTEAMGRPTEAMSRATETMTSAGETIATGYVNVGTVINGYQLTGVIADNTGEAAIFLAKRKDNNYVIKLYHRDKKPKTELLAMIKSIQSPYIIPVLEGGKFEERYYEILPYYTGGDLQKSAPLDDNFIINTVISNVNEGLNALHSLGIIHRDIKPNNIFFDNDRQHVVIGDFGISSIMNQSVSVRMTTGSRTAGYSAPETAQGFVSKESDYYSLGVTLLHLVTGSDPYEGMTDIQILMETLNYQLNIPSSVNPRLTKLIRGLTVKERKERWGYNEIKRWLNNEDVEIVDRYKAKADIKPYIFEGRELYELDALSLSLAESWSEGVKHLFRGFLGEHLKQFGQDLASKAMDCAEERDKDLGFFKLIYIMNPGAPFCWRGEMFIDLYALSASITKGLPNINQDYLDLLTGGALLHFLEVKGFDGKLISAVKALKQLAQDDLGFAYFQLARLLSDNNEFKYEYQSFYSPDELANYLYNQRSRIEKIAAELLDNKDFLAWLSHLGFAEHISKWQQIYGSKKNLEVQEQEKFQDTFQDTPQDTFQPPINPEQDGWFCMLKPEDGNRLFLVKLDRSEERKVSDKGLEYYPIAGNWIYYNDYTDNRIYRNQLDGSQRQKLSDDKVYSMIMVGNWIYYPNVTDGEKMYRIQLDGSARQKLTDDECSIIIKSLGDWIYYVAYGIHRINLDGSRQQKLNDEASSDVYILDDWIYYINDSYLNESDINYPTPFRMRLDGSKRMKLIDDFVYRMYVYNNNIYYINGYDGQKIYRTKLDGSQKQKVNGDKSNIIHSSHDWIYYMNGDDGNLLYRIHTNGNGRQKLTNDSAQGFTFINDWIYYINDSDEGRQYRMRLDGSERQPNSKFPVW
jgi:serine/threonine protein kinase